jgi:hypothetical protein
MFIPSSGGLRYMIQVRYDDDEEGRLGITYLVIDQEENWRGIFDNLLDSISFDRFISAQETVRQFENPVPRGKGRMTDREAAEKLGFIPHDGELPTERWERRESQMDIDATKQSNPANQGDDNDGDPGSPISPKLKKS